MNIINNIKKKFKREKKRQSLPDENKTFDSNSIISFYDSSEEKEITNNIISRKKTDSNIFKGKSTDTSMDSHSRVYSYFSDCQMCNQVCTSENVKFNPLQNCGHVFHLNCIINNECCPTCEITICEEDISLIHMSFISNSGRTLKKVDTNLQVLKTEFQKLKAEYQRTLDLRESLLSTRKKSKDYINKISSYEKDEILEFNLE